MKRKNKLPYKWVTPVVKKGAGLWKQVYCPNGHLLKQIRYGSWGSAIPKKMKCHVCAEEANGKATPKP